MGEAVGARKRLEIFGGHPCRRAGVARGLDTCRAVSDHIYTSISAVVLLYVYYAV